MNIITMDAETFFDDEYSLRKMTTEAYVRDPRFKALGVGLRGECLGEPYSYWYTHEQFKDMLANGRLGFSDSAILAHHAHFDGLILAHHFGVKPRVWLDTLSMARLVVGNHLSVSLDSLSRHFGLAAKNVPYQLFKGKHWADLDSATQRLVADGCLHDVELTWDIFNRLAKGFPAEEYPVIDMTVRMFTEPTFLGDVEKLGEVWTYEERRKKEMLTQLGVDPKDLLSSDKFAELLRAAGCEPETKPSPSDPERRNYCFAKTDQFMKDLLEDDDERVRSLAEARLGVKSTIDQTRAERIGYMAQRGPLPIYLNYAGAHTSRWSGGDSLNWQNLKRGGGLRKSVLAPPGYKIIKADKSNIECRILEYVAGEIAGIEEFRRGEDPYIKLAGQFYGRAITKEDKTERNFGKVLRLQCGFGAGALSIQGAARRAATPIHLTLEEATAARDLYRAEKPFVVDLWNFSDWCIGQMAAGRTVDYKGVIRIEGTTVYLPNGIPLHYPELQWDHSLPQNNGRSGGYKYKTRKGWKTKGVWGGFIVENFIQALSRVDMSQTLLRVLAYGYRPAILEHDAAAWIIKDEDVDKVSKIVKDEMTRAPTWLPDIPLDCEVSIGERYS